MRTPSFIAFLAAGAGLLGPALAAADACNFQLSLAASVCESRAINFFRDGVPDPTAGTTSFDPLNGFLAGAGTSGAGGLAFASATAGTLRAKTVADANGAAFPPYTGPNSFTGLGALAGVAFGDAIALGGPAGATGKGAITIDLTGVLTGASTVDLNAIAFRGNSTCVLGCSSTLLAVLSPSVTSRTITVNLDNLAPGEMLTWVVRIDARSSVGNGPAGLLSMADVSNSLHLYFDVDNPAMTVTSASGHDYSLSAVPLPASAWLLATAGAALVSRGARRAVRGRTRRR